MSDLFPEEFGCFVLHGAVEKADGEDWTDQDGEAFLDAFLAWLECKGLAFGGGLGADTQFKGYERD